MVSPHLPDNAKVRGSIVEAYRNNSLPSYELNRSRICIQATTKDATVVPKCESYAGTGKL